MMHFGAANIMCLAGVYDDVMTIAIHAEHVHELVSLTLTFGVGWTQSPYVRD